MKSKIFGLFIFCVGMTVRGYAAASDCASQPSVSINSGLDIAVWLVECGSDRTVQVSVFTPSSSSWSSPTVLSTVGMYSDEPKIVISSGSSPVATAIWKTKDTTNQVSALWVSQLMASNSGWTAAQQLSGTADDVFEHTVTTDAVGDAMVVWSAVNSTGYTKIAAAYKSTTNSSWVLQDVFVPS